MGALTQVTVTKKNNATLAKTYLMSTSRVGKFKELADGTTLFHYSARRDRRVSPDRYETALNKSQFYAIVREAANELWINCNVSHEYKYGEYRQLTATVTYRFAVDDIILGWDDSENAGYSYLIVEDVHFRQKKYKVTHTIEEIEAAASESASHSES